MTERLPMTRVLRMLPALILSGLLTSSTACTRTVQVPVVTPAVSCPLPPLPPFPNPSASACGDAVCLTPDGAVAVWEWARAVRRWAELATVCLDARA
jgi:hypothetical protein